MSNKSPKSNLLSTRILPFACALLACALLLCACSTSPMKLYLGDSSYLLDQSEKIKVEGMTPGEILDFFSEVAFGSEYGESENVLCRWEKTVYYEITGSPTASDVELIELLCTELNGIEGFPGIRKASALNKANFTVDFTTREKMMQDFEYANERCSGMSEYMWDGITGRIISARCAIDSSITDERMSTVCEEFLQSMGPACDTYGNIASVFYQGKSTVRHPAKIDWAVIKMMYSPTLSSGMPESMAISRASLLLDWENSK